MIEFYQLFGQEGKLMKQLKFIMPALLLLTLFTVAADAQTKKTKKSSTKKPSVMKIIPPLDVRTAREKVAIQLSNVKRFVDVLGPIAQGIETIDSSAKTRRLSQAALDQNEANKQKVITAIRNLKDGLTDLETEFRTKAVLQKYLPNIQGIADLATDSENMAIEGKFVASKEPLRNVAQKLTDTLTAIPK